MSVDNSSFGAGQTLRTRYAIRRTADGLLARFHFNHKEKKVEVQWVEAFADASTFEFMSEALSKAYDYIPAETFEAIPVR